MKLFNKKKSLFLVTPEDMIQSEVEVESEAIHIAELLNIILKKETKGDVLYNIELEHPEVSDQVLSRVTEIFKDHGWRWPNCTYRNKKVLLTVYSTL